MGSANVAFTLFAMPTVPAVHNILLLSIVEYLCDILLENNTYAILKKEINQSSSAFLKNELSQGFIFLFRSGS